VGWSTERFPIPVAFRRGGRSSGISASDSAAFWAIIGEMASDLGRQVFRPATVAHAADPEDVIIVDVRLIEGIDGVSRLTWKPSGELFDVRVTFRETGTLHDAPVVVHEMMHALGFGHTKAWKSVVNPSPYGRLTRLSPDDVAYAEVAMVLRMKHEQSEMRRLITLELVVGVAGMALVAAYYEASPALADWIRHDEHRRAAARSKSRPPNR